MSTGIWSFTGDLSMYKNWGAPAPPPKMGAEFGVLCFTQRDAEAPQAPAEDAEPPAYATGVVSFSNAGWGVKSAPVSLLRDLDPEALVRHVDTIVGKLDYPDFRVRRAALEALAQLSSEALEPHAEAVSAMLEDSNKTVVHAAKLVMGRMHGSMQTIRRDEGDW